MREDWEEKLLIDVVELKSGTTVSNDLEKEVGEIPYLKVADMNLPENEELITTSSRYLSENDIKSNKIFPIGTVIFPKRGGAIATNKKRLINIPACVDLNIMGAIPSSNILPKYLFYYFLSFDLLDISNGSSIPQINNYSFDNLKINLPNKLQEQKRIVNMLDEAFEAIDQAKANIERNIENAEQLFQSKLNEIFSQRGEGWEEVKLGKVCGYQNGFAFKSKTYKDSGTPLIRIGDIQDGAIDLSNIKFIDRDDYDKDLSRYEIKKGDLLIAMSGATTGKIGIVNKDDLFLLNQRVGKFEPEDQLNKDFLYYFLSTKVEEALNISAGSAQPNLSTKQIKDFLIPLPSIKEQKVLVQQLNELSDHVGSIIESYNSKAKGLEELKKSILQKAFSGELTANEQVAA